MHDADVDDAELFCEVGVGEVRDVVEADERVVEAPHEVKLEVRSSPLPSNQQKSCTNSATLWGSSLPRDVVMVTNPAQIAVASCGETCSIRASSSSVTPCRCETRRIPFCISMPLCEYEQ